MCDGLMRNAMKSFLSVVLALLTISTAHARADVSLRNGNFFVSFRDISYPGGIEPRIDRVYNSKSDYSGIYGYGWGTEYETHLTADPDGSLIIAEFGGGANNRFMPKNYSTKDLNASIFELTEAAKKAGLVSTVNDVNAYKKHLASDFNFRAKQYSIFVNKNLVPRKVVAENTQYISTNYQYQYITKVRGGYVRVMEAGTVQKFNEAGNLVQLIDRNKAFINFSYNRNGKMIQLIDNQNRKMNFSYNQQGLLEKIAGESGKYASFRYTKNGLLAYSRDDNGVENTYKYSTDQFENMIEIGYLNDKDAKGQPKKMKIQYYPPDKFSSVKSVTNPDGTLNEYEYFHDPKNPNYYGVRVVLKEASGARISDSKYEYFSKTRIGGENFTAKMISTIDGDKTETTYDERLGYPIKIVNNSRTTTMQYDAKGRMIKKVTPLETTELTYDPAVGKVSRVTRKIRSGTVLSSEFQYDKASGNLIFARNNEKKSVKLIYDQAGRIAALVDESNRQLRFKYNDLSKPIEISDAKLGTVKFTYKNSGEVDKIESNGGANVATEVMRALQGLIDITAPAGVTMSI
jgi:YD repeat-containing protein